MDGTLHIVSLDQKPCNVLYLDEYNKFIVGTYELFPTIEDARLKLNSHLDDDNFKKSLERINYRAGKLILLRGNDVSVPSIEYEFDCEAGGGVFDTKIRYNKLDSSYSIYVAHSNGSVGVYKLSLYCGNKICLKEHIKIPGSKMLTSIDIFPESRFNNEPSGTGSSNSASSNHSSAYYSSSSSTSSSSSSSANSSPFMPPLNRFVVGDSNGFVTVINQSDPIREKVTHGDSIWQVKCLKLTSSRDVIIIGAENSSWYIYGLDDQNRKLVILYKNEFKDFSAGVTSISILESIRSVEYDLVEIWLGSYDETLQTYHVKINHDGISKPDVCHKNTISIDNGGIWRVKPLKGSKNQLCIAAMYGGSYILSLSGPERPNTNDQTSKQQQPRTPLAEESLVKLIDTESLELNYKPLHYDIDVSSCNTTYCIADFNNSLCLFKTIDK